MIKLDGSAPRQVNTKSFPMNSIEELQQREKQQPQLRDSERKGNYFSTETAEEAISFAVLG